MTRRIEGHTKRHIHTHTYKHLKYTKHTNGCMLHAQIKTSLTKCCEQRKGVEEGLLEMFHSNPFFLPEAIGPLQIAKLFSFHMINLQSDYMIYNILVKVQF